MEAITLNDFLAQHKAGHLEINSGAYAVVAAFAKGVLMISRELSNGQSAKLSDISGRTNAYGEQIKILDDWANQAFTKLLLETRCVQTVFSEEADPVSGVPGGDNLIFVDPLDGSSLIQADTNIGSIFSVYQRDRGQPFPGIENWNFRSQICAGYGLYGPATLFVVAFNDGVYEFVWPRGFLSREGAGQEFILCGSQIKMPEVGAKEYSVNEGHSNNWSRETMGFVTYMKIHGYSSRYVGALVADFHRTLKQGGVFLYPGNTKRPEGKLRLFFEAAPMALILEKAGGFAVSDHPYRSILDIKPTDFRQRTPLIFGHKTELQILETYFR